MAKLRKIIVAEIPDNRRRNFTTFKKALELTGQVYNSHKMKKPPCEINGIKYIEEEVE